MIDTTLHFGMQRFFFEQSDESNITYNYYGFISLNGAVLIMRGNKTNSNFKYYLAAGEFDTVFADKTTFTYKHASELKAPKV